MDLKRGSKIEYSYHKIFHKIEYPHTILCIHIGIWKIAIDHYFQYKGSELMHDNILGTITTDLEMESNNLSLRLLNLCYTNDCRIVTASPKKSSEGPKISTKRLKLGTK